MKLENERDDFAYRGYLICRNPLCGIQWIEKDTYFICYASSHIAAKNTIDDLLDRPETTD